MEARGDHEDGAAEASHCLASGGRGCLGEGCLGLLGQVWELRFLRSFPSFPRENRSSKNFWENACEPRTWEPVDPVVTDPVRQDNDKRNNIQMYTEIPNYKVHRGRGQNFQIFISCRYLVELGPRQLGLPVADRHPSSRHPWPNANHAEQIPRKGLSDPAQLTRQEPLPPSTTKKLYD